MLRTNKSRFAEKSEGGRQYKSLQKISLKMAGIIVAVKNKNNRSVLFWSI